MGEKKKIGACAIKGRKGSCRGVLVIFVMGGGYGGREAQEAGCKNIEEEGERGREGGGALVAVFLKAPDFLLLAPNEAEAWGGGSGAALTCHKGIFVPQLVARDEDDAIFQRIVFCLATDKIQLLQRQK